MRDDTALTMRIARYAVLLSFREDAATSAVARAVEMVAGMRGPRPRML